MFALITGERLHSLYCTLRVVGAKVDVITKEVTSKYRSISTSHLAGLFGALF